jgi:cytochrome oxidase Cu insertion factor (SCO1/SenC/PrrC family)
VAAPLPALAHDGESHGAAEAPPAGAPQAETSAKVKLLDLELVDKDGAPLRFESEAVAGHIVAIDFVYTTCTTICPVLSTVMAQVQDRLDGRLGKEIRLISMSIDPNRDTPRRLSDYASKFGAGPNWIWLTGGKLEVDRVLIELGAYSADFIDHPPSSQRSRRPCDHHCLPWRRSSRSGRCPRRPTTARPMRRRRRPPRPRRRRSSQGPPRRSGRGNISPTFRW